MPETLVSPIPDHLPFEQAAVLPLALSTAAAALYEDKNFNLPLPTVDSGSGATSTNDNNGTIIIWGAAGSVGLAAIQLARLSGLRRVVGVASARTHDLVKAVGADEVLDYRSPSIGRDVAAVIAEAGEKFIGILDAVSSSDTFRTIGEILDGVGAPTKVVALMPTPEDGLGRNYVGSHSE